MVSYLERSSRDGERWAIPETAHVITTPTSNVIAKNLKVRYEARTTFIKCYLIEYKSVQEAFKNYVDKL